LGAFPLDKPEYNNQKIMAAGILKRLALFASACALSCVSTTQQGARVRVTSNPDVVRGCEFLGNVKATSGWGGSAGTGLAESNTEKTLQNKTAALGGNVLYEVQSGIHASGEAYFCSKSPQTVIALEPGEELVDDSLAPPEKRLQPLPGYRIITVRKINPDGTYTVSQRYLRKE
jgi:hypothetical protein